MSEPVSISPQGQPASTAEKFGPVEAEVAASMRAPLIVLFAAAAIWLLAGSAFAIISSLKFHQPNILADSSLLTYGHTKPAWTNAMLYGFGMQAGLAVVLWIFGRIGRAPLSGPFLVVVGAILWNIGVATGISGILLGDSTGFEDIEMPRYAAPMLCLGYLMIGLSGVLTFHRRKNAGASVPQIFLLAAVFWFVWIFSTAEILLVRHPVRGAAQAVIAWWYANNLRMVWLSLLGLGVAYHFVPKLTERELQSRPLALLAFWGLILAGSWGGIPNSAPVPSWLPTLSTVATVMLSIPVLAAGLSIYRTTKGVCPGSNGPELLFFCAGLGGFFLSALMNIAAALPPISDVTDFTWFIAAKGHLQVNGFIALTLFGAAYHIVPQVVGAGWPFPKLVKFHLWCAMAGVALLVLPEMVGGILQGIALRNPAIPFADVLKGTLPFLRGATMGDLLIAAGHFCFLLNLVALARSYYRARALAVWGQVTADRFAAEAKA
jgi:cytochrome c oxidase cbb3-type subunit 1